MSVGGDAIASLFSTTTVVITEGRDLHVECARMRHPHHKIYVKQSAYTRE